MALPVHVVPELEAVHLVEHRLVEGEDPSGPGDVSSACSGGTRASGRAAPRTCRRPPASGPVSRRRGRADSARYVKQRSRSSGQASRSSRWNSAGSSGGGCRARRPASPAVTGGRPRWPRRAGGRRTGARPGGPRPAGGSRRRCGGSPMPRNASRNGPHAAPSSRSERAVAVARGQLVARRRLGDEAHLEVDRPVAQTGVELEQRALAGVDPARHRALVRAASIEEPALDRHPSALSRAAAADGRAARRLLSGLRPGLPRARRSTVTAP